MDPGDLPVTPGAEAREDQDTSNEGTDSSEWPWGRPKREALVFLEQALTSDVPRPPYDGPNPRPNMPVGRHPGAQTFTLLLDAPVTTQTVPQMKFSWDYLDSVPRPALKPLTIDDLLEESIFAEEDDVGGTAANVQAEQDSGASAKTTSAIVPPPRIPPRPQLRGILRKRGSSPASSNSRAHSKDSASKQRRDGPNGDRRTVKFQLPQGEGESAPPRIVPARTRRIIKIKSRKAMKYWRETQKE